MKEKIIELARGVQAEVIAHRRHLHAHPEVSFQETETSAYIRKALERYGVPFTEVDGCNSVIARIKGQKPGKVVALRADIDALALQEKNYDAPYRSKNDGVMHACGHDGHTACLLGLAKIFSENPDLIEGEVVLIFQHAEENPPGGAIFLVENGVMEDIDVIFGAHLWGASDTGVIEYSRGVMMASADRFSIILRGVGGHGALPHQTTDSLLAGAALVGQLQNIVSRNVHALIPAVLSVCSISSGTTHNVIPDCCELKGTVRTCDESAQNLIERRIREITESVAGGYGLAWELSYERGYPVLVCDPGVVDKAIDGISRLTSYRLSETAPSMGGEDFAFFTREKPGAYFFIGCRNEEKGITAPHHNPNFDIDERALGVMLEALLAAYFTAN